MKRSVLLSVYSVLVYKTTRNVLNRLRNEDVVTCNEKNKMGCVMVSVTGTLAPRLLMAFPVISQSPGIKPAALCLENPSPAEQDLAVQIQSGAQRGEQMRREVESFAEGTLAKTAAVVFADIIVQRILNPKAT